jgi:hypothetical protein
VAAVANDYDSPIDISVVQECTVSETL